MCCTKMSRPLRPTGQMSSMYSGDPTSATSWAHGMRRMAQPRGHADVADRGKAAVHVHAPRRRRPQPHGRCSRGLWSAENSPKMLGQVGRAHDAASAARPGLSSDPGSRHGHSPLGRGGGGLRHVQLEGRCDRSRLALLPCLGQATSSHERWRCWRSLGAGCR